MPSYPSFLMPSDSVKVRFNEPYASQSLNMKTDGIVPFGIYNGFTPSVGADTNVLILNTDGVRNDSIAVGDVYEQVGAILEAKYNLTIRTNLQIQLDFTGHAIFPVWVVLRPAYSIVAHPFSGLTSATLVTINTLVLNDLDPLALHHGDIKVCHITGLPLSTTPGPGQTIFTDNPTNRNDNGGCLVTQTQMNASAGLFFKEAISHSSVSGLFGTNSVVFVSVPDFDTSPLSFSLIAPGSVVFLLSGTFYCGEGGGTINNTFVGIRVDGNDYPVCACLSGNVGGQPDSSFSAVLPISLLAGAHLAQVVVKWGAPHGAAYVSNSVDTPTTLTVMTKG